ncbi:terpene synthase family protein [Aspergillus terreus]|uniref:Terpene synthase family protein n=1 Tax=Aspergillus terreus TaxID=33178 RepID=A0A5M3Z5M1_ASPTE|nr:hypothetical protein ATETN484_0010003600 [Aspergillus terreus]GFF18086.1 terpene synthase family protein [Aspergillus terreus]
MNFTGLADQLVFGAMGSSPSSTAAYLISRQKAGFRGLPGMYPTTGFEVLWIASTLLDNGFDVDTLNGFRSMIDSTDEFYESLGGSYRSSSKKSVGDADDTARSTFIRNPLRVPTTPECLISTFEGHDHFLTYIFERHPRVTTNRNSSTAILEAPDMTSYGPQIEKIVRYITAAWCDPDLVFADKWNVSEFYPIMLMCDCLVRLLYHWDQGHLPQISEELITEKVPLVLWQALMQTLQRQNHNGSDQVDSAIEQARAYIRRASDASEVEYICIAKTTYSPLQISNAYVSAGLKAKNSTYTMGDRIRTIYNVPESVLQQSVAVFTSFKILKDLPSWQVLGSLIEAQCFLGGLKRARTAMFDRKSMKKDDYLAFIPSTVCCANNLQRALIKTDILHDFMVLIMRVYQLDEYMEHDVAEELENNLPEIKEVIRGIFKRDGIKRNVKRAVAQAKGSVHTSEDHTNGHSKGNSAQPSNGDPHTQSNKHHNGAGKGHVNGAAEPSLVHKSTCPAALSSPNDRLQSLMSSIVHHPQVLAATTYNKQQPHRELRECLLAHVTQIMDSRQAMQPDQDRNWLPQTSYHTWLRTTGSSRSCAPLSLAYLLCLMSREQKQALMPEETYVVQDIFMHLGHKARLENDRASYA